MSRLARSHATASPTSGLSPRWHTAQTHTNLDEYAHRSWVNPLLHDRHASIETIGIEMPFLMRSHHDSPRQRRRSQIHKDPNPMHWHDWILFAWRCVHGQNPWSLIIANSRRSYVSA